MVVESNEEGKVRPNRTVVQIPRELHGVLKAEANRRGAWVSRLIADALNEYIVNHSIPVHPQEASHVASVNGAKRGRESDAVQGVE